MSNSTRDIDQLSERKKLPEGWRWVKLGDVCNKHTGIRDPRLEPDTTFQYVDISSVCNSKKCVTVAKSILGKDAPSRARQIIRFNDVIVATTRPNLNAVAQVPIELDNQICSTGFCVLRAGESIFPEYLFAFVRYQLFVDALSDLVQGALYPAVNDGQVLAQHIPLPPLPEQQRIAAILKEQMGAVEKARMAAQERLRAIKALPAAFLRKIFPDPGQPLPVGWRWAKMGDVCDIKGGKRLPAGTDFVDDYSPFPYIRVVDLKNGTVDTNNLKYLDEATQSLISRYIIGKDDIYISIAGTIGMIGMIPECLDGANLTENAAKLVIRDKNNVFRDFLALFLMSPFGKDFICERTNIVGQPKLALTRIATIPILLPPFPEQKCIAELFNKHMSAVEKASIAAEAELKAINILPAALLRRAFNGEL